MEEIYECENAEEIKKLFIEGSSDQMKPLMKKIIDITKTAKKTKINIGAVHPVELKKELIANVGYFDSWRHIKLGGKDAYVILNTPKRKKAIDNRDVDVDILMTDSNEKATMVSISKKDKISRKSYLKSSDAWI